MKISAPKCTSFQIAPTKDSGLTLTNGERIPAATAESAFTYLSVRISPWADVKLEGLREEFGGALFRASRLSLKPHQKVELISRYLVPHYLYRVVVAIRPVTSTRPVAKRSDKTHLPLATIHYRRAYLLWHERRRSRYLQVGDNSCYLHLESGIEVQAFRRLSDASSLACDQKLASDSSGLSGGFRGIGRGFGL
jgi:hypothetical protein